MPRINADTIAEHVAQQRASVLEAAVRLFTERGVADVTLADVAADVGLARSSLYRYVPDKGHLLVEWYRRAVPDTIDSWRRAVAGDDAPAERLRRWASAYLSWAHTPEHQLIGALTDVLPTFDDATREEVAELHRSMMQVVAEVVADAGVAAEEVDAVVELLAGLVLGAGRAEARDETRSPELRRRLDAAIGAVVGG